MDDEAEMGAGDAQGQGGGGDGFGVREDSRLDQAEESRGNGDGDQGAADGGEGVHAASLMAMPERSIFSLTALRMNLLRSVSSRSTAWSIRGINWFGNQTRI